MKSFSFSAATVLVFAGSALAAKNPEIQVLRPNSEIPGSGSGERAGDLVPFNVANIPSFDPPGSALNPVFFLNLGAGTIVNGIAWDVVVTATAPSWRSELSVFVSDSTATGGFFFSPGTDNSPGGPTAYAGGPLKLANYNIPDVVALGDGLIRLEFFESYDDFPGGQDGTWNSGNLFLQVIIPSPASAGLLGLAGVGLLGRKRR
jgi:hypothetical protein